MSTSKAEWECFDGLFGFPEARVLRRGVLDHDAEHVFTNGHCHSFAEAVRRLSCEAELIFAFDLYEDGQAEGHVLVSIGGRTLDACGWVDERLEGEDPIRAFERDWDRVVPIGPQGWLANSCGWFVPRVDDALPFAEALLARLGVPIDSGPPRREEKPRRETDDRSQRGRRAATPRSGPAPGQGDQPAHCDGVRQR